jgi:3-oxoacyl-[acyl-carrier-protein] synthase II
LDGSRTEGTRRVAVTGLGAVTPVGNDVESTWSSLVAGRSGVGRITTFDPSTYTVQIAGMVKDFDVSPYLDGNGRLRRRLSRAGEFAVAATKQALAASRIDGAPYEPHERGVSMGGSVGRPELEDLADVLYTRHSSEERELLRQAPSKVIRRDSNAVVATLAELAGCEGPIFSVSTACTASAHAIGEAFRRIQEGETRMMLTGGFDSLTSWLDVLGFALLGALTTKYNDDPERASRPFDAERSGFVLGEGAVIAVLEDLEDARERGAPILGEIVGYGSSMNAYRITDAPPDGGGAILAMANALQESGLGPGDFDYVAAHGTGTPGNDLSETTAIKAVFGDDAYRLSVSSNKSMTGHLTAAAGALSLLTAVGAMRDNVVPPTINLDHPDPKLDLDYTANRAKERDVRAVMVNAFAFGGTNACFAVRRPEAA